MTTHFFTGVDNNMDGNITTHIVPMNHEQIRCIEEAIINCNASHVLNFSYFCVQTTAPAVLTHQPPTNNLYSITHPDNNFPYQRNDIQGEFVPHPLFAGYYLLEEHTEFPELGIWFYHEYTSDDGEVQHRYYKVKLQDPGVSFTGFGSQLILNKFKWSRYVVCPEPPAEFPTLNYTEEWEPPLNYYANLLRDDGFSDLNFVLNQQIRGFYSVEGANDVWYYYKLLGDPIEHRYYELMPGQEKRLLEHVWNIEASNRSMLYNYLLENSEVSTT